MHSTFNRIDDEDLLDGRVAVICPCLKEFSSLLDHLSSAVGSVVFVIRIDMR